MPAPGVSLELARQRAATISDLSYRLELVLPDSLARSVTGRVTLRFELSDTTRPLVLDFAQPAENVLGVRVGGAAAQYAVENQHIVIRPRQLTVAENVVEVDFVAGDESLNRSEDFLYTLFVPDRARFSFPCFDQPDLKGRFNVEVGVMDPSWVVVANGAEARRSVRNLDVGDRYAGRSMSVWEFEQTRPISTYLLSFAAGRFEAVERERAGRRMIMWHRETDTTRVARNISEIFDLHAAALRWLESYTGIEYPFGKFDFVLIPSFQYSGMEHPGAILYRAERLLLDQSATQDERLGRASLIAHETAHMWFGDLVTMKWFDDVWMKEVFANFMAAKIVNPSFPEVDHDLRFLLAHHPAAHEVDRTAGANPVRQKLDNLNEAGTLYGAIIYQKAPIVMRQLEALIGEETLRDGLREYLRAYNFANATWTDLIRILDDRHDEDLAGWSRVWVEEPGRPTVRVELALDEPGRIRTLALEQSDPFDRGRLWNQRFALKLGLPNGSARQFGVHLDSPRQAIAEAGGLPAPAYILPNTDGLGYGLFLLDSLSLEHLSGVVGRLTRAHDRAVAWLTLWEAMLEGLVAPARLVDLLAGSIRTETEQQLVERLTAYLETTYWRFLRHEERVAHAPELESQLWTRLEAASTPGHKAVFFNSYRDIALTPAALARLQEIWRGDRSVPGLPLSERDQSILAQELAVREVEGWAAMLQAQQERIENPDRARRFAFVRPALSADPAVRDSFFAALAQVENRAREPWVLDAIRYLHHPLRSDQSRRYILPSLELLQEIQITGDIFFPKAWLDATLDGHSSPAAARIVRDFLDSRPDYPPRLRAKILQSADGLFRAADWADRPPDP